MRISYADTNIYIKRILQSIPLLVIVSVISFFIIRLSPVDPLAELRLNPSVSQETLEKETKRLGLDKPIIVQYGKWAKSFLKGDLGITSNGERVSTKLKERIPNTLLLTTIVIFLTWLAGIPLGVLAALKWKSPLDRILTVLTSVGMAIPSFFFAVLLLILQSNRMVSNWRTYKLKLLRNEFYSSSMGYNPSFNTACNSIVYYFSGRTAKTDEG